MPIFEYICGDCGGKFEELVRNPEESVKCPCCGGKNNKRILSTFAFRASNGEFSSSRGSGCTSCKPASPSSCSGCGK